MLYQSLQYSTAFANGSAIRESEKPNIWSSPRWSREDLGKGL
jgi:hypothetical protein